MAIKIIREKAEWKADKAGGVPCVKNYRIRIPVRLMRAVLENEPQMDDGDAAMIDAGEGYTLLAVKRQGIDRFGSEAPPLPYNAFDFVYLYDDCLLG